MLQKGPEREDKEIQKGFSVKCAMQPRREVECCV